MSYVKAIIDKWDPIDLLAFAPKDEYHFEIERIEQLLGKTEDVLVLSEGIYKIFVDSYGDITFQMSLSECTQIAEMLLSQKPKIKLLEPVIALQVIEDCRSKKIRVLGIDGLKVTPSSTQPFSEHSVDYSDKKEAWDDAIAFVKSRADLGLMFEVVCEDDSDLGSIPLDRSSNPSHFEKGDGWVLCSLSEKFYPLKSIISTGDILNHSIFTYYELNRGLLRLIQNGFAEQSEGKFRITKKGKALIHKLSFPQSLLNGSITNMLLVDEKIVNILTDVEVNYSIDMISVDEYKKAVKTHWSFFESWLKNNK